MNYNLDSLVKEESIEYIRGKLRSANCHMNVFDFNAMTSVANATNGISRLINKLCNHNLIIANSKDADVVDLDTVMTAVNESELA